MKCEEAKDIMSKISIVGVEGSGKTTLMAAFGEKYERPDENGYGLKAENARTFDVVKLLTARMRRGQWPSATEAGTVTNLDWTLYRREGASRTDICSVSFLDFAGEVYRKAFGERAAGVNQKQVDALRNHIRDSDALVVLINLKDVINGDLTDERTREMLWISQGIIEHAVETCKIRRVALAFSQFGVYREAVEAAGGLKGAYAKYLPNVEAIYPDLQLLAISAVDKTVVDAEGREIPAPDYGSTGIEELMAWILVANGMNRRNGCKWFHARKQRGHVLRFVRRWWVLMATGTLLTIFAVMRFMAAHEFKKSVQFMMATQNRKAGDEVTIPFPSGMKMTFCWCPATTSEEWKRISGGNDYFLMGSPDSEQGRGADEKQHAVRLKKGFWIGKYEVSQSQWNKVWRFIHVNPSSTKDDRLPVDRAFPYECQEYIDQINDYGSCFDLFGVYGKITLNLPTEAQWEYACRAGQAVRLDLDAEAWHADNSSGIHPSGEKKGNAWGIHDMLGNVREWCRDFYCAQYEELPIDDPIFTNGKKWRLNFWTAKGDYQDGYDHVIRGGSWNNSKSKLRIARRVAMDPHDRYQCAGFRLVCTVNE